MYLDGVRVEEGMGGRIMSELDPDRIDRIEILKGAAAASRFPDDVEAQRGVILIYTRRDSGRE
jgi:outer membrane cobalamin receptor